MTELKQSLARLLPGSLSLTGGQARVSRRDWSTVLASRRPRWSTSRPHGARLDTVVSGVTSGRLIGTGLPPVAVQVTGTSGSGTHLRFVFASEGEGYAMAQAVAAATRQPGMAA